MNDSTLRHPFIEVPQKPREMKRSGSPGDPDGEPSGTPAKRPKSSKACHTCRQHKTRCWTAVATSGRSLRCNRCTRFNIECSFERSPPPLVPQSVSTTITRSPAPPRDRAEPLTNSGPPAPQTSRVPGPPPSRGFSPSPSTLSHPQTVSERRPYPQHHPITPMSPPRSNLNLEETQTPMDMATTTHSTWSRSDHSPAEQWAAPLSFTRELIEGDNRISRPRQKPTKVDDLVARGVVSVNEAGMLSQIWRNRFAPWLPIEQAYSRLSSASVESADERKEHNPSASSAFLQAAQWTLAARHLTYLTSNTATSLGTSIVKNPLLEKLVQALQQGVTRASLGLDLSLPALRALLILATWSSSLCDIMKHHVMAGGSEADDVDEIRAYDGEMLISIAVHIATQMHLELDVEAALNQAKANCKRKASVSDLDLDTLERARTMFSVSAANTMLNLGKGRLCSSAIRLEHAEQIFGSPSVLANRPGGEGDACMVYQCNLLAIALRMADRCTEGVLRTIGADTWTQHTKEDLQALDHLQQTLTTTSALTSPNEIIPITTVILQSHFLKINMIFRAFRTLFQEFPELRSISPSFRKSRFVPGYVPPRDPYDRNAPHGRPRNGKTDESNPGLTEHHMPAKLLVHEWGTKSKECTESLMATSLVLHRPYMQLPNDNFYPIAHAPDYTLLSILFGASYAVKVHTMIIFLLHEVSSGTEITRSILDRVLAMFCEASSPAESPAHATPSTSTLRPTGGPHHPLASRCASALSALIKLWDARMKEMLADVPTANYDHESHSEGSPKHGTPATPGDGESRDSRQLRSRPIPSISPRKYDAASSSGNATATTLLSPYPLSHTRSGEDSAMQPSHCAPPVAQPSFLDPLAQLAMPGAIHGVQGELFGLPPNFDMAPFYDPVFMFSFGST